MEAVRRTLREDYLLAESKIDLLTDTLAYQREVCGKAAPDSVGVYIGIPFCPTRCLYCSFTSNQVPDAEIARYLEALKQEIAYVGRRMRQTGLWAESIYIGGGTPTTLTAEQLDALLGTVEAAIDLRKLKEFTVEAGRPETITYEKLEVLQQHHIARISINPQSMHAKTLDLIGREHRPDDIVKAFQRADWVGIPIVNADVITGLPEESPADFAETMEALLALDPENITVHTLAVKRASRLVEVDKDFHYKQGETVKEMLAVAQQKLKLKQASVRIICTDRSIWQVPVRIQGTARAIRLASTTFASWRRSRPFWRSVPAASARSTTRTKTVWNGCRMFPIMRSIFPD